MFKYTVKKEDSAGLNSIVSRFGFSNYREAGVSSVPSGNFDLIRPGDEITLNNYDPNKVGTITDQPPAISSEDNSRVYDEGSAKIDNQDTAIKAYLDSLNTDTAKTTDVAPPTIDVDGKQDGETRGVEPTGDAATDTYLKYVNTKQIEADNEIKAAEKKRLQREQLFKTSLAALDATTNAILNSINLTYDKVLSEQKRINSLNIARMKAYGLGSGAYYTPISFSNAMSVREAEAANKVADLEDKRNNLIAQAKNARDKGEVGLMQEKFDNLDKIDDEMRSTLRDIEKDVRSQYDLFRKYAREQEDAHKKKVEDSKKALLSVSTKFVDDYEKDKEGFIQSFLNNPTVQLTYADIFETMEQALLNKKTAITTGKKSTLALQKSEADIARVKMLNTKTQAEIDKINRGGTEEDFTATENKKLEQAGLSGVSRQQKLDYLYMDDLDYEEKYEGEGGGDLKSRVEAAGYDYDKIKAQGYTDEEIEEALK